jgi:hypothetical protein
MNNLKKFTINIPVEEIENAILEYVEEPGCNYSIQFEYSPVGILLGATIEVEAKG